MKRKVFRGWLRRGGCAVVMYSVLAGAVTPAHAISTGFYTGFVSQLPGVYTTPPDVNVMFTLDDSGSMAWEFIPDTTDLITDFWSNPRTAERVNTFKSTNRVWRYYRSPAGNPLYYNPDTRYTPWPFPGNDQRTYPGSSITAACRDADTPGLPAELATPPAVDAPVTCGITFNVAARVVQSSITDDGTQNTGYWPGTYFRYKGTTALQANGNYNQAASTNDAHWEKVEIRPGRTYPIVNGASAAKAAGRSDCAGASCTYEEEIQNFANWFTYYRTRMLMAKGGVAHAFARQGTNMRVGYATLHSGESTPNNIDGVPTRTVARGVRKFWNDPSDSTRRYRTDFFTRLYGAQAGNATPLRRAVDDVGRYFMRRGTGNPWAEDPANTLSAGNEYTCRRSFHILSTDGFWNTGAATGSAANDNDDFTGLRTPAKPDGTRYDFSDTIAASTTDDLLGRFTISPFRDNTGTANTLSDAAAYYWKTDLRDDLANRIVPSRQDPGFWQHLTMFTVGLGITGTGTVTKTDGTAADLSTQTRRDALVADKTPLRWTVPVDNSPDTGDDLVHAAMVGRGRYFSATNPTQLANGLSDALSEVADQPLDQASVAADAPQLRAGGKVYQATFSPSRWYGRMYAFTQDPTSGLVNNKPTDSTYTNPTQVWEASNKLPAHTSRNIFTSAGAAASGTTFLWGNLTAAQKSALDNDATLLDYLRGDGSREIANGGSLRDRSRYTVAGVTGGPLGDVVSGSPVKGPDAGGDYDRLPASDPAQALYGAYRAPDALQTLRNTLFFAANDGMMHAVDATTGIERFAYVPNAVYTVPRSTTAQLPENKLRMLADPSYAHRFTADGPPNVSDAFIGGAWRTLLTASNGAGARGIYAMDVTDTAVGAGGFGSGRILWEFTDSTHADMGFVPGYPHVVKMRNGAWAAIFGNGYDSARGQAKLFVVDVATGAVIREFAVGAQGDNGLGQPNFVLTSREVTTIYAGDLKGQLWKFDVSSSDPAQWNVAFGGNPLFRTPVASGMAQPIAVMPEIERHPQANGGVVVVFGTGKLFESSDSAPTSPPNVNLQTQSLYGIWDKPGETSGVGGARATVLQEQTWNAVVAPGLFGTTSSNAVDWTVKRGWYMDLAAGGERINLSPQIVRDTVFFVANTPTNVPCFDGGTSRIIALDPATGRAPSFAVFSTGNVRVTYSGVLTQPMFQFTEASGGAKSTVGSQYGRGDASGARRGGFEPSASKPPCDAVATAALSNTQLISETVKLCRKRRISWRQIR